VNFSPAILLIAAVALSYFPGLFRPIRPQETSHSAKSLTHLLEEHYRQPRTFQAAFLERYSEGQKQSRVESGTVYFLRPGKMRWEYESPERKLFLVDGKNAWFYVPYDHTVTRTSVKESTDWRTPLVLLTGKPDLSRLCREISVTTQPGVPPEHAVLRCLPKEAPEQSAPKASRGSQASQDLTSGENYLDVFLEIDESTGELERIEIQQRGGVQLEYRFGNWRTDIPLSADLFRFQVPAGVAIVNGDAATEKPQ
jgi:outer membrane lipoprotein carrier protein